LIPEFLGFEISSLAKVKCFGPLNSEISGIQPSLWHVKQFLRKVFWKNYPRSEAKFFFCLRQVVSSKKNKIVAHVKTIIKKKIVYS